MTKRFLLQTAIVLGGSLSFVGCGSSGGGASENGAAAISANAPALRGAPAVVVGTTIDAATGKPVSGVFVEGPAGTQAHSDAEGRFELRGIPLGTDGELVATAGDGRTGKNSLRPLASGRLEVVLFLR